jgi:hypothetical protein
MDESEKPVILKVPENLKEMTAEERRKVAEALWEQIAASLQPRPRDPQLEELDKALKP